MASNGNYYITWFLGDKLLAEKKLKVNASDLAFWLNTTEEELKLGCFSIQSTHAKKLQRLIKHKIDLNKYDYFVEYMVEPI